MFDFHKLRRIFWHAEELLAFKTIFASWCYLVKWLWTFNRQIYRLVRRSTEVKRIQPRHFSLKGNFRDLRVVLQTHHIDVATHEPFSHISRETIQQRWRLPPDTPKNRKGIF